MPNYCKNKLGIRGRKAEIEKFLVKWGTKWDAGAAEFGEFEAEVGDYGVVFVTFCTAYGPRLPLVVEASQQFPDLQFSLFYFEEMIGFEGAFIAYKGEVILDGHGDHLGEFVNSQSAEIELPRSHFTRFENLARKYGLTFSELTRTALRELEYQIESKLQRLSESKESESK